MDLVCHVKPTQRSLDIVPLRLFIHVSEVVALDLMSIVDCGLLTGVVPYRFKHAVVQPLF